MSSIRFRLTCWILAGVAAACLASGLALYRGMRREIVEQFDAVSLTKVRAIGSLLEEDGRYVEFEAAYALMPEFRGGEKPEYFQIWLGDGRELARSATLPAGERLPKRFGPLEGEPKAWDLRLPDGRPGRAAGAYFQIARDDEAEDEDDGPEDDEGEDTLALGGDRRPYAAVVVARSRVELNGVLAALRRSLYLAGSLLALAVVALVVWTVGHGLRPLVRLSEQIRGIDASTLSTKLPAADLPVELRHVVKTLNGLLERLERAFERERRMTGSVAHELRTPIAELRSAVEIALRWPDDEDAVRSALMTAERISVRMGDLVAGLLRLARITWRSERLRCQAVPVDELFGEMRRRVEPAARSRGLSFAVRSVEDALVHADRDLLSIAMSNLIENAVWHAEPDSEIECRIRSGRDAVEWSLANRCSKLSPSDLDKLTEPFWRKDEARGSTEHHGLGLSLVNAICEATGIEVSFSLDGDRFAVVLRIPRAMPRAKRGPSEAASATDAASGRRESAQPA